MGYLLHCYILCAMAYIYEKRRWQLNLVVYYDENTKYCKFGLKFLHIDCKIAKDSKMRGYTDGFES